MAVVRTRAIVLRHTTDREHDRILTVLTPQAGQLRLRARGTKKSVSKLGGSLEPMTEVDVNIADGRTIGLVTGSVILDRFDRLRSDAVGLTMAQWFMELVEAMTKPGQASAELYGLTARGLRAMAEESSRSVGYRWLMLCRRAWQLMTHEGFIAPLDTCSVCHRALSDEETVYDPRHGFMHRAEAQPGHLVLSPATIAFLRDGQSPLDERPVFTEAHSLIEALIHHTLDRPLRSERVLRSIVRLAKLPKESRTE